MNLYKRWHKNKYHHYLHWQAFLSAALLAAIFLVQQINVTYIGNTIPLPSLTPASSLGASVIQTSATSAPLIQSNNLTYLGAFRLPAGGSGGATFSNGGTGLAYYSAHDSLFAVGHYTDALVAEVSIPTPSQSTSLSALPSATFIQPFTDILEGKRLDAVANVSGTYIGGMVVDGSSLITTVYGFYDANNIQINSHFKSGLDFSVTGDVQGPFKVGSTKAGFVAGYMAPLPEAWQSALGGTHLTGQCCLSITNRTSSGPAISAFNASDIGIASVIPATELLGYPLDHQADPSIWEQASSVRGVFVPPGTRSVLFIGRKGTGDQCYGAGTSDLSLAGQKLSGSNSIYCYDAALSSKGYHSYPYVYQVWAYDLLDLQAVKEGHKRPYDLRPYAMWTLDLPFTSENHIIQGATFDPATSRIFISAVIDSNSPPIVYVFKVNNATPVAASTVPLSTPASTPVSSPTTVPAPVADITSPAYTGNPVTISNNISGPIAGDINRDGIVDDADWALMKAVWFTGDAEADLNHDGIVNSLDFSIMNGNWLRKN